SPSTFNLVDDGTGTANKRVYSQVSPGDYTVTENGPPAGYKLDSVTCVVDTGAPDTTASGDAATRKSTIHIASLGEVTCTYVNKLQQGAIKITKTAKNKNLGSGDQPQSGVLFSVTGPSGTFPLTTGADGTACVDHLSFGTYTVTETVPT